MHWQLILEFLPLAALIVTFLVREYRRAGELARVERPDAEILEFPGLLRRDEGA